MSLMSAMHVQQATHFLMSHCCRFFNYSFEYLYIETTGVEGLEIVESILPDVNGFFHLTNVESHSIRT